MVYGLAARSLDQRDPHAINEEHLAGQPPGQRAVNQIVAAAVGRLPVWPYAWSAPLPPPLSLPTLSDHFYTCET